MQERNKVNNKVFKWTVPTNLHRTAWNVKSQREMHNLDKRANTLTSI